MRGYAAIGLDNPKGNDNVGGVMRAAYCYGAALVVVSGPRYKAFKQYAADPQKAWRHLPAIEVDDVFDAVPYDCVPVAVEFLPNAKPLPTYQHPERAFYILGPEDGTLGKRIIERCRDIIMVPTAYCMNLAATANVILYDRLAKQK